MDKMATLILTGALALIMVGAGIALIAMKSSTDDRTAELTGFGIFMLIIAAMIAVSGIFPTLYSG